MVGSAIIPPHVLHASMYAKSVVFTSLHVLVTLTADTRNSSVELHCATLDPMDTRTACASASYGAVTVTVVLLGNSVTCPLLPSATQNDWLASDGSMSSSPALPVIAYVNVACRTVVSLHAGTDT